MTRTLSLRDAGVLFGLATLVVVMKIPTLDTPYYWDEASWALAAHSVWEGGFLRALPGYSPHSMFFGHPVGLHVMLAAVWRLLGDSIVVAHGFVLVFCVAGVAFTYLLGRTLYGTSSGVLAALSLFLSPVYFAQSGMFLGDMPVTALGVASVYFALHRRLGAYLACASLMVMIKETGMAIVVASTLFVFLTSPADRLRLAWPYALPLIPIGAFLGWQKLVTGELFWIIDSGIPVLEMNRALVTRKLVRLFHWTFVDQLRWIFTALVAIHLLVSARARRRTEWWVFGMIAAFFLSAFYVLYYLPRYVLPVMPYLYIGGAGALMTLVPTRIGRRAAAVVLLAVLGWSLPRQRFEGNAEFNLGYLDVVAMHRVALEYVTTEFPGGRIVTGYPHLSQLRRPFLGYVPRPVPAVSLDTHTPAGDDVILLSAPGSHGHRQLDALAAKHGWRLVQRFQRRGAVVVVYRSG